MSDLMLGTMYVCDAPWGKVLLVAHLLICTFALGVVTHHAWELLIRRQTRPAPLARYAWWAALGYALAWLSGCVLYPTYNYLVRKSGGVKDANCLESIARWAVGLFEIKEHLGTFALAMLPLLVVSAYGFERLSRGERVGYKAVALVFTLFVYYTFIAGAVVAAVKGVA